MKSKYLSHFFLALRLFDDLFYGWIISVNYNFSLYGDGMIMTRLKWCEVLSLQSQNVKNGNTSEEFGPAR